MNALRLGADRAVVAAGFVGEVDRGLEAHRAEVAPAVILGLPHRHSSFMAWREQGGQRLQRSASRRGLVPADAGDAGEAHGEAGLVARRALDALEGDFEDEAVVLLGATARTGPKRSMVWSRT